MSSSRGHIGNQSIWGLSFVPRPVGIHSYSLFTCHASTQEGTSSHPDPCWASALCRPCFHLQSHGAVHRSGKSLLCFPRGAVLPLAAPFSRKPIKFIQDRLIAPVRRLLSYRPEKMVPEMRCWQVEVEGNG